MPATIDPEPIPSTTSSPNVQAGVCPLCGAQLHNPDACDRCDWVTGYGHPHGTLRRNPRDLFAAILCLFWPGAGQFYKGHTQLAVIWAVLGVLCFLWSITFLMFGGPLILPSCWGAAALHAYFLPDLKHPGPVPRAR
jgi:TM2 domain-containing membrane protein YozV